MDSSSRAVVLTGTAFPVGATLGALFGMASAPRDVQGFGDIVWVIVWFILGGGPLTMLTFWFSTSKIEWSWTKRKRAMFRMLKATFLATGVLIASIWFAGRSGNGAFSFVSLPVCSLIVTLRARALLRASTS